MGCTLELFAVYLFLQSTHFECTCRIIYIYWGYGDVIVRPLGKLHTLDTLKMSQNFSNKQQAHVSMKSWYSLFSIIVFFWGQAKHRQKNKRGNRNADSYISVYLYLF